MKKIKNLADFIDEKSIAHDIFAKIFLVAKVSQYFNLPNKQGVPNKHFDIR